MNINKRILVVDDEPLVIRSLTFILAKEGYEVMAAADGEEALHRAAEVKPALMFLDIMLPRKNGYEVCEIIKKSPELKGIYVIILSAKGGEATGEKAIAMGANEYISKPFSPLEIISRVRIILQDDPLPVREKVAN